ncbi:hypothetical protein N7530_000481 [Penicillium desertorum]|uniref:Uncharacterized protein n=1 Tax=Penicillium desertorum TaxID=1303715 RepID=A0A9X0BVR8_9EURO|nr:hypothetical protein N7530_000481 [Penicillium desertorum]
MTPSPEPKLLASSSPPPSLEISFLSGPYVTSRKEPDLFVRYNSDSLPSFVIESGWSERWNDLLHDMNLLLVGGDRDIRAVVILKWKLNRLTSKVSGFAELYVRDRNGVPIQRQRERLGYLPRAN